MFNLLYTRAILCVNMPLSLSFKRATINAHIHRSLRIFSHALRRPKNQAL